MKLRNFRTIATAAASAVLLAFVSAAYAQQPAEVAEADDQVVDEITVTGIRQSLIDSIASKRNAKEIVDAISSEEIGKFPDTNIAESLQRITGVAIDRDGGEGQFITIRGLGPSFNTVLFNGRMYATDTWDRSFSLDILGPETIKQVKVYKSPNASLTEGSIGGSVHIRTARPFDNKGFTAAGTFRYLYTDSSGESEPQASFLVSKTFSEDRLGFLFSANHSERTQTNRAVQNFQNVAGDLRLQKGPSWTWTPWGQQRVIPDVVRPQSIDRNVIEESRERNTAYGVMQFDVSDNLGITADAMYTEFDVKSKGYTANTWFWYPTGEYPDAEGGKDPILDSEEDRNVIFMQHGASGAASAFRDKHRPSSLSAFGLNFDWQASDNLSMATDVFWSQALNKNRGYNRQILIETGDRGYVEYDYTQGGDHPSLNLFDALPTADNIGTEFPAHVEAGGNYIDAENVGAKIDFTWNSASDVFTGIDFGAHFASNKKLNDEYRENPLSGRIYKEFAKHGNVLLYVPAEQLQLISLDGGWAGIEDQVHAFQDVNDYLAWLADPATLSLLNAHPDLDDAVARFNDNGGFTPRKTDNAYRITEDIVSLYLSANFEFELGDMPLDVVIGGRYTATDLSSEGTIQQLLDLEPGIATPEDPQGNLRLEKIYAADGDYVYVEEKSDNTNFLPSLMANLHITDELIFRFGASKTLTRPILEDLAPWLNIQGTHIEQGNFASGSNPDLKPYLSTNLDLSLEWYYGEGRVLSLAYFTKDVKDWIVRSTAPETFELETSPYTDFIVSRPRNIEKAEIDGVELNWIHNFDSGFGLQANYTKIDSNAELNTDIEYALQGLGDSANFISFFERGKFKIRAAYNWRDEFLQRTFVGWTGQPMYVGEYDQIDVRTSYRYNDKITIFAEGLNVTDSTTDKYGFHQNQFLRYLEFGPRYTLGLRGRF